MAYDNNVPQANQTIAQTQPIINANFAFIQTDLQQDHCFNGNGKVGGQTEGTHNQVNLPTQATPAIAANCVGTIYANGNNLFWNSAAGNYQINQPLTQFILTGTQTLNTSTFVNIVALPANSVGTYYLIGNTSTECAMGQFVTSAANTALATNSDPNISISSSGLNLTAKSLANNPYAVKYVITYFTP